MIQALIHGKLSREQENMEDILTSNVFGALRYNQSHDILLRFLKHARTPSGKSLLEGADTIASVEYIFWPSYADCDEAHFCQPDLELRMVLKDRSKHRLFIEAKFNSGKSSLDEEAEDREEADEPIQESPRSRDQLAKEWAQLVRIVGDDEDHHAALIYLTADTAPPLSELEESAQAAERVRKNSTLQFECFWLSWRHLYSVLKSDHGPVEADLLKMLDHLQPHFFRGFQWPKFPENIAF